MNKLSESEYASFVSALNREPYERRLFDMAVRKLRYGSAVLPEGMFLDRDIPETMHEWRNDKQWSLTFAERYNAACDAAWREFWRVRTSE